MAQPRPEAEDNRLKRVAGVLFDPEVSVLHGQGEEYRAGSSDDKRIAVKAFEAVALTQSNVPGGKEVLRVYYNRFKVGDRKSDDIAAIVARLLIPFKLAYVIEVIPTNGIRPLGPPMGTATRDTNGCLIGTLGIAVTNTATAKKGFVTCNHVAAAEGPLLCPNAAKAKEVGLSQYTACDPSVAIGKLTAPPPEIKDPPVYNNVDAAFVEERGSGVDPTNRCGLCPNGEVMEPADAEKNHVEIHGCGAVSGPMTGNVKLSTAIVRLTYSPCGVTAWFADQIEVDGPFAVLGDSGTVAFDKDGTAVGLVFAGDGASVTYLNPMTKVRDDLGVVITKCTK